MIARSHRGRSGITLTEILISILIMGIGLISLATLFPLGLIKLLAAAHLQRGAILVQSVSDDMEARSLLLKSSFTQTWYGGQDPFTQDAAVGPYPPGGAVSSLNQPIPQPGLPVCYDPLLRAVTNIVPLNNALFDGTLDYVAGSYNTSVAEARFGAGFVLGANGLQDAYGIQDKNASAHGLQRITNFIPWSSNKYTPLYPFTYQNPNFTLFPAAKQPRDVAGDTFTSVDDPVFNSPDGGITGKSPVLPDLSLSPGGVPTYDWRYTWFFTGHQVDSTNGTMFQGDVVICDSRPFAFGGAPASASISVPAGELVVEAIFGYSTNISPITGFAVGADRTVLLRWPITIPDPTVRAGGWIADVTYERDAKVSQARVSATATPFQRCYWYQVAKRGETQADPDAGYRRMVLTINSPVRVKTRLTADAANNNARATDKLANVALLMNSVINVYSRSFTIH
jgi:hypothetical protein